MARGANELQRLHLSSLIKMRDDSEGSNSVLERELKRLEVMEKIRKKQNSSELKK